MHLMKPDQILIHTYLIANMFMLQGTLDYSVHKVYSIETRSAAHL